MVTGDQISVPVLFSVYNYNKSTPLVPWPWLICWGFFSSIYIHIAHTGTNQKAEEKLEVHAELKTINDSIVK